LFDQLTMLAATPLIVRVLLPWVAPKFKPLIVMISPLPAAAAEGSIRSTRG